MKHAEVVLINGISLGFELAHISDEEQYIVFDFFFFRFIYQLNQQDEDE